ncbi:hypothetical protein ACFWRG_31780 [Micromonospora tulbaghiae]|uniref:Uncharacterized protein n=2 Tax=Streptomyces TaxID=1883 RepID=A0A1E7LJC7_9ACTN|nr:hypothetical protein [Streptomyces nanshensis]OEV16288.1 hypothetical protein AN221_32260 [Streptomyces nanshensis]
MSYPLGDPIQSAIRCPKDCGRLLINGQARGCTWRAEPDPDPLVGRLVAFTDQGTGRVLAAGKVTGVDRADDGMTLTVVQHEDAPMPPAPRTHADPGALPDGMNWRDHL